MKIKKITTYTDKEGSKKKTIYEGKKSDIVLITPSDWYIENEMKPRQDKIKEREEKERRDKMIQQKLREIATIELKKEGKL